MNISVPYGRGALDFKVEDELVAGVLRPREASSSERGAALARAALEKPIGSPRLSELARGKKRVLVITSDHTRPVPSRITMPLLLEEIRSGSPDAEIVILLATGMHRPSTPDEISAKFGTEIAAREKIENHISTDAGNMVFKGILPSGGRLMLNGRVDWAELIVAEGFIEPHFFAGFSGGRKSVLPGIASEETVRYNHNARFIADARSRQGLLEGNPIHADMACAARAAGLQFILNVLVDGAHDIVAAVAGEPEAAHARGCEMCLARTEAEGVEGDVVITSNGGYPLDQNIYQAVKGMTAAEACVREGGVIITAAECADGCGGEGFFRMLADARSPEALIESALATPPEMTPPDQWQAQILARVLSRALVIFVTRPENRALVERMRMLYAASPEEALSLARAAVGERARIVAIPDGVGVVVRRAPRRVS